MAAKPKWLLNIPEIRRQLSELAAPVVDRDMVERLFDLRRRRAIELMHCFGGFQSGRTFLIDRLRLLSELGRMEQGDEFANEARRRERLGTGLSTLRRNYVGAAVRIPVQPEVFGARVKTLRDGVRIDTGRLEIDFSGTEDLLAKLFELAQAAANDFETFEAATSRTKAPA